jgi:hypothetical protein
VAEDLRFCPLCGKFVAKDEKEEKKELYDSYPCVDMSYIYIVKWIKIVKAVLIFVGILSVLINLIFKTPVLWFPYVIAGLIAIWRVCFYPFKEGKSHISCLPTTGIIIALLLIFIDVYDYNFLHTRLGWALSIAVPAVFGLTSVVSLIIAMANKELGQDLTKGIFIIGAINIIFFICKLIWFNQFFNWPIFMSLLVVVTCLFLLFLIKKKRLVKELNRNYHL